VYKYGIYQYHGIYHYGIYHCICELTVLTFRFPCQVELQYLVWSLQPFCHLHLSHWNHLRRVPAALSGIQTMNATGTTTTTFRWHIVILLLVLDALPGLNTDAIAAMIRDLPMPNAVEVPGLRVDEAIEI
jgi:hypothetical protein